MKRVLSIMLTMMLVFSLFTGVITASAAVETAYSGDVTKLKETLDSGNDVAKYGTTLYFRTDGNSYNGVTSVYDVNSYLPTDSIVTAYPEVAKGITSQKVIKVDRTANTGWFRVLTNSSVTVSSADTNTKYQATFRVYLTDIKDQTFTDNGDGTYTHTLTDNITATELTMYVNPQNGTSSAGGTTAITPGIPVNQWTTVTADIVPTKSGGKDRTANGFRLYFGKNGNGIDNYNSTFASTMFIDGNFKVEKITADPTITLADYYMDGKAIVQRNAPIEIWGTSSEAGNTVTVTLGDNTKEVTTVEGKWSVTFPAMPATESIKLNVSCNDDYGTKFDKEIAVGDVILAAGQSNMNKGLDFVSAGTNSEEMSTILADVDTWSNIEILYPVSKGTGSLDPVEKGSSYKWLSADPTNKTFLYRSAVGLLTAYNIAKSNIEKGYNVPIGVIEVAMGGAKIEAFMSKETLEYRDMYSDILATYEIEKAKEITDETKWQNIPTSLYNAWISPIKGAKVSACLWYQGENNANVDIDKTSDIYYYKQLDLFNQFRKDFGNANMPIAVIQLAPFDGSGYDYTKIRQSQLDISNTMNNVYLVPTADLGPVETDSEPIHPTNKLPIAERCANVLKYHNFGEVVEYSGPTYKKMTVDGNEATLTFLHTDDYETTKTLNVKNLADNTEKAGYPRFGAGTTSRWEFRPNGGTGQTITRPTVATVSETYPDVATGLDSARTLAKVERINKTGFLRIVNTNVSTAVGDHIRMTIKVYPTDIMLNASTADTNNSVEKLTWQIKAQRGGDGSGVESEIQLIPNEWNTIEYEFDVKDAGVNGAWLNYGFVNGGNTADTSAFAATLFFDGEVKFETLPANSVAANSLKTSDGGDVKGFKVCGADGVFYDATAEIINGNQITVSSESVANPVEVQYCIVSWDENDHSTLGGNVVNAAGIPMVPFKATLQDADIVSASLIDGYSYKVNLASVGYNAVTGKIVAVLYDGDILADVQFVDFNAAMHSETTKTVTFTPAGEVTNPSVKIMAWNSMNTLVPYCEAFPVQ